MILRELDKDELGITEMIKHEILNFLFDFKIDNFDGNNLDFIKNWL